MGASSGGGGQGYFSRQAGDRVSGTSQRLPNQVRGPSLTVGVLTDRSAVVDRSWCPVPSLGRGSGPAAHCPRRDRRLYPDRQGGASDRGELQDFAPFCATDSASRYIASSPSTLPPRAPIASSRATWL